VDMTAPRATTQYTRESLIKPFRTPKDLTLHPPMPLYIPLLTPQTPLLHNINVKVEVTLTPTPTLILSHVSALMLFYCPRLALYTHIYASSIAPSLSHLYAYLSLSLFCRQSLLYDSQFNISIHTRLISTPLIMSPRVTRTARLLSVLHTVV
jgi:hypothetical protein